MSLAAVLGMVYTDTHFLKCMEKQAEFLQYPFIQAQKPIMLTRLWNKDPSKSHFKNQNKTCI